MSTDTSRLSEDGDDGGTWDRRHRPGRAPSSRGQRAAGSDAIRIGVIGCGGRGTGAVDDAINSSPGRDAGRDGRHVRRIASRRAGRASPRSSATQDRRRRIARSPGFDAYEKVHRERRELHHPGDAARVPPGASRGRGRRRQAHLHREAGRGGRPRHPRGAGGLRAGESARASALPPARSAATRPATSRR